MAAAPFGGNLTADEFSFVMAGQPLLFDVYGNPRTNGLGARNVGTVQAVPEPSIWRLAGPPACSHRWRQRVV